MASSGQRAVNLRVVDPHGTVHALAVDFSPLAVGSHLRAEVCDRLGLPFGDYVLHDVTLQALIRDGSPLDGLQLYNGQLIAVVDEFQVAHEVPVLSADDRLRIVHESGFQLGFAWPVSASAVIHYLAIDRDSGVVRPVESEGLADLSFATALRTGVMSDGTELVAEDRQELDFRVLAEGLTVRVNGRAQGRDFLVTPGALIQVNHAESSASIDLRVMSPAEHDLVRLSNGSVNYRARPAEEQVVPLEPKTWSWTAPAPPKPPEWDWKDVALQEGSMFVVYLALILVVRSWYMVAFMLMPITRVAYRYFKHRKDKVKSIDDYHEAVDAFDRQIGIIVEQVRREAEVTAELNPGLDVLSSAAHERERMLWQRHPVRAGFLRTTIGIGVYESPSDATISGAEADPHIEVWRGDVASVRMLHDAPIEHDFLTHDLAVVGPSEEMHGYLADLVLRLSLQHSPGHLAIAALLPKDEGERESLRWLRWLPHTQTVTDLFVGARFPNGTDKCRESVRLSAELAFEAVDDNTHLLLLVHEAAGADAGDLERYRKASPGRVHFLWIGSASSRVPAAFGSWIELEPVAETAPPGRTVGLLFPGRRTLACQLADLGEADAVAGDVACLVDEAANPISQAMPQLVGLGSIAQPPQVSPMTPGRSPQESLVAALGEDSVGVFELDLVEQGPHVLVAGTTGSGKSELLRAMVLSLACRYRPSALSMMFVDYKGGSSLGDLDDLPHSVGMVTNLDALEVDRLVRFLQAEIERRQGILAPAPYNGEYKEYYKRKPGALPRFLMVIDEFAGFIGEGSAKRESAIMNLAARGRSLGVHLVIATQSPRGVVTSQVRANVNARIALRVLDQAESEQVIDSKEASRIPRALKGRAFARLDSGEIRQFQSALTKSQVLAQSEAGVIVVNDFDPVIWSAPSVNSTPDGSEPTDAETILYSLPELAHVDARKQPPLKPSLLDHSKRDVAGVRDQQFRHGNPGGGMEVMLGRRDEPERQRQSQGFIDLAQGSILFTGDTASGRTHALAALALDFVTSQSGCQLVCIDGGGGALTKLLPQASLRVDAADKGLVTHLLDQLDADYGERSAPMLVLIDRLDVLEDILGETTRTIRLFNGGARRGIHFAATCDARLPLDPVLRRAFRHRYEMIDGHTGTARSIDDDSGVTLIANPVGVALPTSHLLVPDTGDWSIRFPLERVFTSSDRWRPVGYPRTAAGQLPVGDASQPGFALGIDEVRHETVQVAIGSGLGIAGRPASGKTTTLLTICARLHERTGKQIPVLLTKDVAPELVPDWMLDLRAEWDRLWCGGNPGNAQQLMPVWDDRDDVARVIAVDDNERALQSITYPGFLPVSHVGNLAEELNKRIQSGVLRLITTGTIESFLSLPAPKIGGTHLTFRKQLINLQPIPVSLMPSWSQLPSQATQLFANVSDRVYGPGEGSFSARDTRRELKVLPEPSILAMVDYVNRRTMEDF